MSISVGAGGSALDRLVWALERAGRDPKVRGRQLTARCPLPAHAHGDRHPSLSATWDGTKVLMTCHACGPDATTDIVASIGLTMAELWDEPRARREEWPPRPPPRARAKKPKPAAPSVMPEPAPQGKGDRRASLGVIVARYDYVDADGGRVMRVLRYDPKDFRQSRWNGRRWVTGGVPVERRVLWRLPAVRAAAEAGGVVWVVEGEKDVLACEGAGLVATTHPGGAASTARDTKWLPQYVDQLAGARVVVVADRDVAGARHALVVRDSLRSAGVVVLRVVEAAEGKDAHDHLVEHGLGPDVFVEVPDADLEARVGIVPARAETDPLEPGDGASNVVPFPAEGGSPNVQPRYGVSAGELVRWKQTKDGWWQPHTVLGCEARLVRIERAQLDESEPVRSTRFVMALRYRDGSEEEMIIPARDWNKEGWLCELPPGVYYNSTKAGIGDLHRAIGAVSGVVPRPVAMGALGWQQIDGHGWCYIHAGGAIGAEGPVEVLTDFSGDLANMTLPVPSRDPVVIREAAQHSLGLVDSLSPRIGATVAGVAYRSVLDRLDWVVLFRGPKGTFKTSVANVAMSHLSQGRGWNDATFTLTATGTTVNAPQEILYRARHSMTLADDVSPDRGEHDAAARLSEFVRMQANHIAKQRLDRDAELRRTRAPRGASLATAEFRPSAPSAVERTWDVRFAEGDVDRDTLEALHDPAASEGRALLLASYLQWLAGRREWALDQLAEERRRFDEIARRDYGVHVRVAGAWSELAAGWSLMLSFLVDVGAIDATEKDQWWAKAWAGLVECAEMQRDADLVTDLGQRFLRLLASGLGRSGHLCDRHGGPIEDRDLALAAGWTPVTDRPGGGGDDAGPAPMRAAGTRLGVLVDVDGELRAWLDPAYTTAAVRDLSGRAGTPIEANEDMIREALDQLGVLRPTIQTTATGRQKRRLTVQHRMLGGRSYVWDLPWAALGDDDQDEPESAPVPPGLSDIPAPAPVSAPPDPAPGPDNVTALRAVAPAIPQPGSPSDILPVGEERPCEACGHPARCVFDGHVLHPTEACLTSPHLHTAPVSDDRAAIEAVVHTPDGPGPPAAVSEPDVPKPPAVGERMARPRAQDRQWRAPAGVVDAQRVWLPGGELVELPGEVVDLAGLVEFAAGLGLGHGGGRAGTPDEGQLWLTGEALERFGLPATIEGPGADGADKDRRALAFAALNDTPAVVGLQGAGWRLGNGGRLDTWVKVWHPDRDKTGLRLVFIPWHNQQMPILAGDPAPVALADRLARFADLVGITYRLTPAATGIDLMHWARPTNGRGPGPLRRAIELPAVAKVSRLEGELGWHRQLEADEKDRRWVHGYDRNGSYLAATSSLQLGLDVDPTHHRDGAPFSAKVPGYWRIPVWDWPLDRCPNPIGRGSELPNIDRATRWVTTPTLELLVDQEVVDPDGVLEAWLWDRAGASGRYLAPWNARLRDARRQLLQDQAASPDDPDTDAILRTVKDLYKTSVGKLARQSDEGKARWRPDWRHHIQAQARANIMRRILAIGDTTGSWPVAAVTDAIFYVSNEADPTAAWPGKPEDLGDGLGRWKVIGTAPLDSWAAHLEGPRFRLGEATDDLTATER